MLILVIYFLLYVLIRHMIVWQSQIKQNQKTIEFWNDLYKQDATHHKEWILHPSHDILQKLLEALPHSKVTTEQSHAHVLEIGCGTSTLSRDFWRFCRHHKDTSTTCTDFPSVSVCVTDVSPVCIGQNSQRDQEDMQATDIGRLEYRLLNIAEPIFRHGNNDHNHTTIQPKSFDMTN